MLMRYPRAIALESQLPGMDSVQLVCGRKTTRKCRYINYGRRKSRNAVQLASAYVARGVCWLPDSGGGVSLHSQYASLLKREEQT